MASLTSSRVAAAINLSWTFQAVTRTCTRTLAISLTATERASQRRRRRPSTIPRTRYFSTQSPRHEETPAAATNFRRNFQNRSPARYSQSPNASSPSATAQPSTSSPQQPRQPPPETDRNIAANPPQEPIRELSSTGLSDLPQPAKIPADANPAQVDWTSSFHGLSSQPFSSEAQEILLAPIDTDDIEIKPDGILYLPEIKYRRILNKAFGPGGWGLAPRGETIVTAKCVTREYALLASGRLVSIARGEMDYFDAEGIPTATEGCKSNALMRCCKDLGVASELWDPRFIRRHMAEHAKEIWVEHAVTKRKKKVIMRKDDEVRYPFKEVRGGA